MRNWDWSTFFIGMWIVAGIAVTVLGIGFGVNTAGTIKHASYQACVAVADVPDEFRECTILIRGELDYNRK